MEKSKLLAAAGSLTLVFLIAALVLVVGPGPVSAQDEPIELKMQFYGGTKAPRFVCGLKPWAEMVEKATKGRVKVSFSFARSILPHAVYDATIKATVDGGAYVHSDPKLFPLTMLYGTPGLDIKDSIIASRIIWSLYRKFPEIRKEHKDVKVLFTFAMAPMTLATKKPARSLSDIKGMKIGAPSLALVKLLGAERIAKGGPRGTGPNLEKGVIEGSLMGLPGQINFGVSEIAKYFTVLPGGFSFVWIMNRDKWNSLSPDIQDGIMSVSGDAGLKLISECDHKSNQKAQNQILAEGKEIIYLSPDDTARLAEAGMKMAEKQIADLEAKGLPARAVLKEISRMTKEY